MIKHSLLKCLSLKSLQSSDRFLFRKYIKASSYQICNFQLSAVQKTTRQLKGLENRYMYEVINKKFLFSPTSEANIETVKTSDEFNHILSKNYKLNSGCLSTDVLKVFRAVGEYSLLNHIDLSDKRFDNLVDGLMDHCEKLSDDEILKLMLCLAKYPKCTSFKDHNFHDVWSCLNDICCERIPERDIDYLMKLADTWYELDLGRIGEFIISLISYLSKKAHKLTKDQIVRVFFFTNVSRRKSIPFEFEEALEKYLDQLTIDEFGVIALGYFKSMSKIKLTSICLAMMEAVKRECSTVNQITLAAILKVIRFTKPGSLTAEVNSMLNVLLHQIDRLSPQCCLHVAIIGTGMLSLHKSTMEKSTQKLVNLMDDVTQVRLKDIERIINATTMVDFRPNVTPDLFETAFKEIQKDQRKVELALYPKILPCVLNYLSIMNMYSNELMDRVLDKEYIEQTYGKGLGAIPRDIFLLDCSIDIECPSYKGNRLPVDLKYKLVKWVVEFVPSYNQYTKLTAYDKLYLDVEKHFKLVLGDGRFLRSDHVTPHFPRADIILCKDTISNKFIEPPGFQRYVLGDLKYPMEDSNLKWYAITVVGWNNTIRGTSIPVGMLVMKQRHLKKMGYHPKMVIWNRYMSLDKPAKIHYIKSLLI